MSNGPPRPGALTAFAIFGLALGMLSCACNGCGAIGPMTQSVQLRAIDQQLEVANGPQLEQLEMQRDMLTAQAEFGTLSAGVAIIGMLVALAHAFSCALALTRNSLAVQALTTTSAVGILFRIVEFAVAAYVSSQTVDAAAGSMVDMMENQGSPPPGMDADALSGMIQGFGISCLGIFALFFIALYVGCILSVRSEDAKAYFGLTAPPGQF